MNAPFVGYTLRGASSGISDLSPDHVSRAELLRARLWCRSRRRVTCKVAGLPLCLSFTTGRLAGSSPPRCLLRFTMGGHQGTMSVALEAIDALFQAMGAPLAAGLGERSLLLLLEFVGATVLDQLENMIGESIVLTGASVGGDSADGAGILCRGTLGDLPFAAVVALPAPHEAELALRAGAFAPLSAAGIPVTVAFRFGVTRMRVGLLAGLRAGDVVLVEHTMPQGRIAAVFGERRLALCHADGNRATLLDTPLRIAGDLQRNWTEADMTRSEGTDAGTDDVDFDDIEIKLVFELGRLEISLGELRTLAPGYVFDLGRDPQRAVEIHAGPRRIGHGEIVRIGETLGVRIVGLFNIN